MENVVLTVHLILALLLTGVVLLQRSEGGGLGMGSGGGGGAMSGRQAANWMTRITWGLGIAIFVTSVALTVIAARSVSNSSIMDQLGASESQRDSDLPTLPEYTPPPSTSGDPLTPPSTDAPAASEAAAPAAPTESGVQNDVLTPPASEAETGSEAAGAEDAPAEGTIQESNPATAPEEAAPAPATEQPQPDN